MRIIINCISGQFPMWQDKLAMGNQFYDQQEWRDAYLCYMDAAQMLDELWQKDAENPQLMMAWIACLHNLADMFNQLEQPQRAMFFLMKPYQRVIEMVGEQQCSEPFQFALIRAARCTLDPLLQFSQHHPMCQCCRDKLQRAQQWLEQAPADYAALHQGGGLSSQRGGFSPTIH